MDTWGIIATVESPSRFICWPVASLGHVNRGSVVRHCAECLSELWVAPSTLKYIRKAAIKAPYFWCVSCATRAVRRKVPFEIAPPTDDQLVEIAAELRRSKQ